MQEKSGRCGTIILNGQELIVGQLAQVQAKLGIADVSVLTNPYTFTNATPLRTINVSTASLTDALNCLAALTGDLKAAGILPP